MMRNPRRQLWLRPSQGCRRRWARGRWVPRARSRRARGRWVPRAAGAGGPGVGGRPGLWEKVGPGQVGAQGCGRRWARGRWAPTAAGTGGPRKDGGRQLRGAPWALKPKRWLNRTWEEVLPDRSSLRTREAGSQGPQRRAVRLPARERRVVKARAWGCVGQMGGRFGSVRAELRQSVPGGWPEGRFWKAQ